MSYLLTALALGAALVVQSGLSLVAPGAGRLFDPFLLVVVYCGLTFGETHGMLAGAAAGWVQDIQFGGLITGLTPLTKLLVGFATGAAATRFLLQGSVPRLLVLFAATLVDALVFERLAFVFEVPAGEVSVAGLLLRALVNAAVGVVAFRVLDQRARREVRV